MSWFAMCEQKQVCVYWHICTLICSLANIEIGGQRRGQSSLWCLLDSAEWYCRAVEGAMLGDEKALGVRMAFPHTVSPAPRRAQVLQNSVVAERTDSGTGFLAFFKFQLCHFLAVWSQGGYLTPLSFIYKIGINRVTRFLRWSWDLNQCTQRLSGRAGTQFVPVNGHPPCPWPGPRRQLVSAPAGCCLLPTRLPWDSHAGDRRGLRLLPGWVPWTPSPAVGSECVRNTGSGLEWKQRAATSPPGAERVQWGHVPCCEKLRFTRISSRVKLFNVQKDFSHQERFPYRFL